MSFIDREVALLRIRNIIANKELVIAQANMETQRCGGWTCDWFALVRDDDAELQGLFGYMPLIVETP